MNGGMKLVLTLVSIMTLCRILAPERSEWLALGFMIAAGIPHGAFDLRVAEAKWRLDRSSRVAIFSVYTLCVCVMSGLCIYLPQVGLAVFLVMSAIHFAEGEAHATSPTSCIWGCVTGISAILLPIGLHPEDARTYVSFFVSGQIFNAIEIPLRQLSRTMTILLTLALLWSLYRERGSRQAETLQRLLCVGGWIALPPLCGFSIWFLGRHSRQHLEACRALFDSTQETIPRDFLLISLLAIAGLAPFAMFFDFSRIDQLFAASICLIAGLTLPHMIVSHRMRDVLTGQSTPLRP
jgi:Brp/Blh family beta-carotene 15,15'-monooxygenase